MSDKLIVSFNAEVPIVGMFQNNVRNKKKMMQIKAFLIPSILFTASFLNTDDVIRIDDS